MIKIKIRRLQACVMPNFTCHQDLSASLILAGVRECCPLSKHAKETLGL